MKLSVFTTSLLLSLAQISLSHGQLIPYSLDSNANPEELTSPSTSPTLSSTIFFDDIDTSHTGSPTSTHTSKPPKPTSPPPPTKTSLVITTTIKHLKKLVRVHINPDPYANHPTKPASEPTFADYEQGIVYLAGVPHQVLEAHAEYSELVQDENGTWVEGEEDDDDDGGGGSEGGGRNEAEGKAVYSADVESSGGNAIKKAVFFTTIAAAMITVGLLVFFKVIK
ncbi:hypothetical protein ABW19_dt0209672 [Dactylella cylindrospora]|nr:hypothetical protein ABW19_dt0209672 [Dactylella cylindrospora]